MVFFIVEYLFMSILVWYLFMMLLKFVLNLLVVGVDIILFYVIVGNLRLITRYSFFYYWVIERGTLFN